MNYRLMMPVLLLWVWPAATADRSETTVGIQAIQSSEATIIRDEWGVPHIYGPTDASVVFGAAYAQAEDNWWQVEDNFVRAMGRGAELHGEDALLDDYLARGLEIVRRSIEEYERASDELRALYDAFAAGFNHYLETHPNVERRLLDRVEPWFTLALIRFKYHHNEYLGYAGLRKRMSERALERDFVGGGDQDENDHGNINDELPSMAWPTETLSPNGERATGSNEWAVAGSRTVSGYPMLLINPHVSFYGLSTYWEVHLESDEGLVFSGNSRFGFMLPYMGNNGHHGWAYTDNMGDHGDLYIEELNAGETAYLYGDEWLTLISWTETIHVVTDDGLEPREFRFSKTHHGPILGIDGDGQPLAVRLAKLDEGGWFEQWYGMMHARSLEEWRASVALLNVPYMNTMYADVDGNILYIYNHAIPRRSLAYDWSEPVNGTDPGTEWNGYHTLDELPQFLNPASGYLQNTNSTPFTATEGIEVGPEDFPRYMVGGETDNRRAQNSRRVLSGLDSLTLDDFAHAVLNTRLIAADEWLGDLFLAYSDYERLYPEPTLAGPISALAAWDHEAARNSVPTTLFILWAGALNPDREQRHNRWIETLTQVVEDLESDWGTWEIPWGRINRIQRPDAAGLLPFDDNLPSLPVAGAPGWLGSVFTFHGQKPEGEKRLYGMHGNSFVKVVEFTPTVRARSIFVFGQSGDPESPHYFDQAELYSDMQFKPSWFSREDVEAHAERVYTVRMP